MNAKMNANTKKNVNAKMNANTKKNVNAKMNVNTKKKIAKINVILKEITIQDLFIIDKS